MSITVADRLWQFGYKTLIRKIYKFQRKRHAPDQAYRRTMRVVASSRLARFLHARQTNVLRLDLLNFTALHLHHRIRADGMTIRDFLDTDPARFATLLASNRKAILLSVHNGYALCPDPSANILSQTAERPRARFLKDKELDVYDAHFDTENGEAELHDKLNRRALRILLKADADIYFARFDFKPDGTVIPVFHGPVEQRTPEALEAFISQFYPRRYH